MRYLWGRGVARCRQLAGEHLARRVPTRHTADDGFLTTAPMPTFQPSGYGPSQTMGNVSKWCGTASHPATTSRRRWKIREDRGPHRLAYCAAARTCVTTLAATTTVIPPDRRKPRMRPWACWVSDRVARLARRGLCAPAPRVPAGQSSESLTSNRCHTAEVLGVSQLRIPQHDRPTSLPCVHLITRAIQHP
jgi:hypothetical protein